MKPFRIDVSDETLADLQRRLDATILPSQTPGEDWSRGIPVSVLATLVERWRDGYDWRAVEQRLNSYEQFTVELDGAETHVLRRRATTPGRLPVILTHGWPHTMHELLPLVDALDGPMDVVVPSLPGFAFSAALDEPFSYSGVARRWHTLMTDVLGYDRYLTYGEDVGAGVNDWLAGQYPDAVAGIVASHASLALRDGAEPTPEEADFLASIRTPAESGYAHLQGTRPDTLAAGLADSPSGLIAWIGEKLAAWSDGDGLEPFTADDVITPAMLLWVTRSIGTSFRPYCDDSGEGDHPVVTIPASILVQTHEATYPRSLADQNYADIRAFRRIEHGGHFTAFEAPREIAEAILTLEEAVR